MAAITAEQRADLVALFLTMFGKAPTTTQLARMVTAYENGTSFANIGISASTILEDDFALVASMDATSFATYLTNALLASDTPTAAREWATNWVITQVQGNKTKAQVIVEAVQAIRATTNPNYTSSQTELAADITATLADIDNPVVTPKTYTLTTGVDSVVGTASNDIINGNVTTAATLSALDVVDGGAGTDTLNVADPTNAAYTLPTSATIKNVEVLNIAHAADATADVVTVDVSAVTGLQTLNVTNSGTDVAMNIDTKGNVTSVTLVGGDSDLDTGTGVDVSDGATTDTLASVTLSGFSDSDATTADAVTINSGVLTSLKVADTAVGATVTAAAGTRALGLTLDGVTGGTITDATATSLAITASGTKSTAGTVVAGAATTVSIAADEALTLTALTIGAATGLTVTGDSLVTLSAATLTALTSIDASAQTAGGVDTDAFALGTGVTFTGGAGKDSIQVGATTKAIATGAGDDRVLISDNVSALGSGGSIDAGEGTDTIALSADEATTISTAGTFDASISNFEQVELAVAGSAGVTVDLSDFDDASKFKASVDVTQTIAVTNMASGGTVAYTAAQAGVTTVSVTNALANAADSLNISLSGSAAATNAGITVADVETLAIATSDTDGSTADADIAFTISALTAAAAKSVTVTGNAGLTLTSFTATTVTSFDASGMTTKASDGGVSWTTGALAAAATITGSGGDDTFVVSAATKAVTVNGGAGDDTITAANALANVINAGDGNDTVTMGSGNVTIDLGAGTDTLVVGSVATQTSNITLGAGVDTVDINAVQGSAGAYLSLTDFAVGDKIDVAGVINGTIAGATLGSKVTLGAAATFANYIDAIAAGDGETANSIDGWFQLGGNTYLVIDNSDDATFQDGADIVVEIVGLVDLSSTTQAAGVYTLA